MPELERCTSFLRDLALRCAQRTEPSPFGTVLLNNDLQRVWSLNYLLAEQNLETATAALLAAEADRVLGGAGLRHRKVEVLDGEIGASLEPQFKELNWQVECDIVMVARRPPATNSAGSQPEEVTPEVLEPVWAEGIRGEPFGREDETVRQLVAQRYVLRDALGARFFAARVNGELASFCDLYSLGGMGQIEGVLTIERFRNRGLARAVVSRALQASEDGGNTLTFLVADRDDWPKELYRKLGFEEIGSIYEFRRSTV